MYPVKHINISVKGINGYINLDKHKRMKNIFVENFVKALYSALTNNNAAMRALSGSYVSKNFKYGLLSYVESGDWRGAQPVIFYGNGAYTESPTNYNLQSLLYAAQINYIDVIEDVDYTSLILGAKHSPPEDVEITEAGLGVRSGPTTAYCILFTYKALTGAISRNKGTIYNDGYELRFGNIYTKWFVRTLMMGLLANNMYTSVGLPIKDINGNISSITSAKPIDQKGKIVLGSGTKSPSPDDYYLESPVAEITSISVGHGVDTNKNVAILKFSGSIQPETTLEVNEIGVTITRNPLAIVSIRIFCSQFISVYVLKLFIL